MHISENPIDLAQYTIFPTVCTVYAKYLLYLSPSFQENIVLDRVNREDTLYTFGIENLEFRPQTNKKKSNPDKNLFIPHDNTRQLYKYIFFYMYFDVSAKIKYLFFIIFVVIYLSFRALYLYNV